MFIASAQIAFVNSVYDNNDSTDTKITITETINQRAILRKYTIKAINQINDFLHTNLKENRDLSNLGKEGRVTMEVQIKVDGTIQMITPISSTDVNLEKIAVETMQEMKSIDVANQLYRGVGKVKIPIKFTL